MVVPFMVTFSLNDGILIKGVVAVGGSYLRKFNDQHVANSTKRT
jgi:hypothetical protein